MRDKVQEYRTGLIDCKNLILLFLALAGMGYAQGNADEAALEAIRANAYDLRDNADLDPLLERIGDARFVLLGEASHGTSEFYTWRARITRRLIEEKGFSFVAVEGDWPDAYKVNRYVREDEETGESAYEVLNAFERWPTWMWANWEIVAFTEWLRNYNDMAPAGEEAGFYGLDVYSLWESLAVIMSELRSGEAETALAAAGRVHTCFEPYEKNEQAYAQATLNERVSCEAEAAALLAELQRFEEDVEEQFSLVQNAHVVVNAERYYRAMARGGPESWNVRDVHMADTLDRLVAHHGSSTKAIVWEHNTHIGDARATDMAEVGMVNIGQLVRERHGSEGVILVGFGSHHGTVIAAKAWGAPMEVMPMPPAEQESWENLLARAGENDKLLLTADLEPELLLEPQGHRAIGVVYQPSFERFGNYVATVVPERYDAFIYLHETEALHPLHLEPLSKEPPELYPWGF